MRAMMLVSPSRHGGEVQEAYSGVSVSVEVNE